MKNIYSTIFILAIFLNILAKNPKISGTYNSYREICEITNFSIQNNLLNIDSIIINNEHGGIDVFGGGKCPDNYVVDVLHLNKKAPRFAQFGQLNSYEPGALILYKRESIWKIPVAGKERKIVIDSSVLIGFLIPKIPENLTFQNSRKAHKFEIKDSFWGRNQG